MTGCRRESRGLTCTSRCRCALCESYRWGPSGSVSGTIDRLSSSTFRGVFSTSSPWCYGAATRRTIFSREGGERWFARLIMFYWVSDTCIYARTVYIYTHEDTVKREVWMRSRIWEHILYDTDRYLRRTKVTISSSFSRSAALKANNFRFEIHGGEVKQVQPRDAIKWSPALDARVYERAGEDCKKGAFRENRETGVSVRMVALNIAYAEKARLYLFK